MTLRGAGVVGRLTGTGAAALTSGGQRIVVVGAGGWLGLATLELLHRLLGPQAFAARVVAFGSNARVLQLRDGLTVAQRRLSDLCSLPPAPSLVLHLAFLTQEKAKAMRQDAYMAANRAISEQVLDALDPIGAEGIFVPSSGAVYMVDDLDAAVSVRQYGFLKLQDEASFSGWSKAREKRAVIARVFNLSGPYINKHSGYALACFIGDALAGRPIEIKALRPVYRSYVAVSELMSVVFGALTDGKTGPIRFDTAGDHKYEMSDIAETVIKTLGVNVGIVRFPSLGSGSDIYVGNSSEYEVLRGFYSVHVVNFMLQVAETANYLGSCALKTC